MSPSRTRRTTTLAELEVEFRSSTESAHRLIEAHAPAQLLWKPPTGAWSIAECLDHLAITASQYQPQLERSLKSAPAASDAGDRRYRFGFFARQFKARMEPPVRGRYPAPRSFQPAEAPDLEAVLDRFEKSRRRYAELFDLASTRSWWRARARNPLLKGIRLGVADWLGIMAAHDRRHLWQAKEVTAEAAFPSPAETERKPIVL